MLIHHALEPTNALDPAGALQPRQGVHDRLAGHFQHSHDARDGRCPQALGVRQFDQQAAEQIQPRSAEAPHAQAMRLRLAFLNLG